MATVSGSVVLWGPSLENTKETISILYTNIYPKVGTQ